MGGFRPPAGNQPARKPRPERLFGAIWMVVGVAYGAVKTRGFRSNLVSFDVPA